MKPLVVDGPRMSDIAEPGESALLAERLSEAFARDRPVLGVHLWTHSPRRFLHQPILRTLLRALRERGVPLALQVSITGLGATPVEPGIEPTGEALASLRRILREHGLAPDRICLRIDPVQCWQGSAVRLSNEGLIDGILEGAAGLGIRRARVSLIAYERYRSKILPRLASRGLRHAPVALDEVCATLRGWIRRGVDVRSCACDALSAKGVAPGACFDYAWVTGMGGARPERPVAARKGCLCLVPEDVLLWKVPRRSPCRGGCLACYAQDHSD